MSKHSRASKAQQRREEERREAKQAERDATHYTANGTPYPRGSTFRIICQLRNCDQYVDRNAQIPLCSTHSVQIWTQVQQQLHKPEITDEAARLMEVRLLGQSKLDANKARDITPTKRQMTAAHTFMFGPRDEELSPEDLAAIKAAEAEDAENAQSIYYIRQGDLIKIGYSSDLESRLRSYGPAITVLAHHFGTRADERDLHRTFRPCLAHGREWYHQSQILLDHIDEMIRQWGEPWCIPEWSKPRAHSRLKASPKKPTGISL